MTVQVLKPKKQDFSQYLPVAGAAIGGIAGSIVPGVGTMAGITAGSTLGGLAGTASNMLSASSSGNSAVDRRMAAASTAVPPVQDPMKAIEDARLALSTQPDNIQQQYSPMLAAAALKLRRDSGANNGGGNVV